MTNPTPSPTPEQLNAIKAFKLRHGAEWKLHLLNVWMAGTDGQEPQGYLLRQVRNQLGPVWLVRVEL